MQSYPLGHFSVSRVGFGAMQLPGPGVFGPPRDRPEALAVLRRAVELGVDHIDTSQYYGPDVANELIREALYPYPGNLALVSKVGARRDESGGWLRYDEPDELRKGIEDNLSSLGTGQLAAVNLRLIDGAAPDQRFDDQLGAMITARDEGLIGGVGLSNVSHAHLLRALEHTDIACVQNPLNLVDRASMPVLAGVQLAGHRVRAVLPAGLRLRPAQPGAGQRAGTDCRRAARLQSGPGRAGLDAGPGAQRPADSRHVQPGAPGGEPRGGRYRA